MRQLRVLVGAALLMASLPAQAQDEAAIKKAVEENPHRSEAQMARDQYRHPVETLTFFGVEPHMTVAEPLPGWYTQILGSLLREEGTYIGLQMPPHAYDDPKRRQRLHGWRDGFIPALGEAVGERAFARFQLSEDGFAAENSVDAILSFRSFHGWMNSGRLGDVLAEFYRVLKPGGVLGIVQHRENEDSPYGPEDGRGYLKESFVIEAVELAGFELAAKSEINANPKDTKDYEPGVWALPPTLAVKDEALKEKHKAIGESDRMTLKFVKPSE